MSNDVKETPEELFEVPLNRTGIHQFLKLPKEFRVGDVNLNKLFFLEESRPHPHHVFWPNRDRHEVTLDNGESLRIVQLPAEEFPTPPVI